MQGPSYRETCSQPLFCQQCLPLHSPHAAEQSDRAGSLLEEVIFAVDAFPAAEAALSQRYVAVTALETLAVPMSVQSLKDEAVQDVLITAGTHRDLCGYKNNPGHGTTKMGDGPFTSWNQLAELKTSRAAHLPLQAIQGNRRILYPAAPLGLAAVKEN